MVVFRRIVALSLLLALFAWPIFPALTQDSDEAEKSRFIRFVEEQLSAPNRQISLNGIEGTLSSDVRLRSITVADEEGVWLTIVNPQLKWTRSALLTGRLEIESLTAERIEWPRMPVADDSLPSPETSGFSLPELPVSVSIGELAIPEAAFGEPVFGLAATLSLDGSLALADGALDASLDITRLDGPGGALTLEAAYSNETSQLAVDLSLREPANGVVANLLNIPDRPPVELAIDGTGTLDDFNADLAFDADSERIASGTFALSGDRANGGRTVALDLAGPIARILPEEHRAFFGDETGLAADLLLRADGGIDLRALDLDSGALDIAASGSTLAGGFIENLTADITLRTADAAPVRLPLSGEAITVANGALSLRYQDEAWTLTGTINDVLLPEARVTEITLEGAGDIDWLSAPANRSMTFSIDGDIAGINPDDAAVANAIGKRISLSADGAWSANDPIRITAARITGETLSAAAEGLIDGLTFTGNTRLQAADLAAFSLVAGREIAGSTSLAIDGDIALAGGGFDVVLDGTLNNARFGAEAVDRLLSGETRLQGGAVRSPEGLQFDDLRLSNPRARIIIDGGYATTTANLRTSAEITDIARVIDNGSGRLSLEATVAKAEGSTRETPYELDAELVLGNGRLAGRPVQDLVLAFNGQMRSAEIAGNLNGSGAVGGETIAIRAGLAQGEDRLAVSDLDASLGSARISGGLSVANGVADGSFDIAARDISTLAALALVDASGSLNGTATISGSTEDPTIAFTASGSGLTTDVLRSNSIAPVDLSAAGSYQGNTVSLSRLSAKNAQDLDFSGSGTIPLSGAGLSLRINGSAPLAIGERWLAARGTRLSGTIRIDANVTGSLAAPNAEGLFSLSGANVTDPLSNLRLTGITGIAGLRGDTLSINRLTGQMDGGGSLSVSGTIGLSGALPANLDISLSNVTYSDRETIKTTLTGNLALDGPLTAGPLLSGTIDLYGTEITVPETIASGADLLEVRHVNTDSGTLRTLSRIAAVLPKEASGTPQAPVRLDITVNSPNQIFVRGRGIDAELGGRVRVTGSLDDVRPVGAFTLIRGRLSILNKRLQLTEGRITLTGSLDPLISLTAEVQGDGIVAYVVLNGRASDLSLDLSSAPELPEDEILARVLFGKGIASLSPLQIANLATAAASLASGGSGAGLSEQIRQGIGVDDLDITQDTEGNVAVRAGKYVQDNVYLDVQAGQAGGEVSINLDITDSLTAKGSVDTDGDSRLGVFFEKDY